jgi:hypothetical protein
VVVRLVRVRRIECTYVYVKRRWKYSLLEVDLADCQLQGLKTLDIAREVARLLYERVISRSEAWTRTLLDYPVVGRHVMRQLLEFIERGEVTHPDGRKTNHTTLYFFENPRVWTVASPSRVVVVAERYLVEDAVGEVEKLLEERLEEAQRGGGSGPQG